jgi:hypothetical protein
MKLHITKKPRGYTQLEDRPCSCHPFQFSLCFPFSFKYQYINEGKTETRSQLMGFRGKHQKLTGKRENE